MSRWASVVSGLAIVAIVVGVWLVPGTLPAWLGSDHTAEAWLRFRGAPDSMGADQTDRANYDAFRRTQFQLLKSPVVLNAALRRPGITDLETIREQEDPIGWLSRSMQIVANDQSEVVRIQLRGKRGDDLVTILKAVTDVYLEDIVKTDHADRISRREALVRKYKEMQEDSQRKRQRYADLVERNGHPDAISDARSGELALGEAASLRAQHAAIRTEARSIRADIEVGEAVGETVDPRRPARLRVLDRQAAELEEEIGVAVTRLARRKDDLRAMETLKQEIDVNQRVTDQIGLQLESTAFELTAPPRVTLLEEVSVRKSE